MAAVAAIARQLGLPALLGPAGRRRDIVLALIISRVLRPKPKLSTLAWWPDTTLGADLGAAGAVHRRGLRMALFDLTSAWLTGRCCELAARGYSRDGKKGCEQIEYGVLTDPAGRPVAVRVFPANRARTRQRDPPRHPRRLGIQRLVLVGDRGMITSARIEALRKLNEDPDTATDFGWITALRARRA